MRDLPCTRLEMDEIWGFVGKKDRQRADGTMTLRSAAFGRSARLMPIRSWFRPSSMGNANVATATAFVAGRGLPDEESGSNLHGWP